MPKLMPTKWSGKEIGVTIGYAFLLLLCYFASDCLGFFGPFFWVYGVPIMLLVAGIPYFYIAAREPRYGTFTIVGVLFLLYGIVGGVLSNVPYLVCVLIGVFFPDLVRMAMGYDSFLGTLVSYLVFAIARIGAQINIWLKPEWCHDQAVEEMGVRNMPTRSSTTMPAPSSASSSWSLSWLPLWLVRTSPKRSSANRSRSMAC